MQVLHHHRNQLLQWVAAYRQVPCCIAALIYINTVVIQTTICPVQRQHLSWARVKNVDPLPLLVVFTLPREPAIGTLPDIHVHERTTHDLVSVSQTTIPAITGPELAMTLNILANADADADNQCLHPRGQRF